ncbi:MAG: glycosyltransferase family 39 protein [Anaerolineae bacterium]|nr:glycosyltransferase family 39 protein [Anaerolineae bacterium]MDW8171139.1 glycosyltransferase family 39 protein [Anaerolineae bacterium]
MPDLFWLRESLSALPLALLIYVALGLPWSLLALPRAWWPQRGLLWALAFGLGPALMTAWAFVLGTLGGAQAQPLMNATSVSAGVLILALLGALLVWRKARQTMPKDVVRPAPLARWEWALIGLMGLALLARWVVTSYWVFTAYDTLWVYGYQGRLYSLQGFIPINVGYYPPFLSLQYAFMQMPFGVFDDHYARVVIPFIHLWAILAAYSLGRLVFDRRVGFVLATLWTFFPQVGEWAMMGDLEIPLTASFTLAAALFLWAWIQPQAIHARRAALLSGLMLGLALWTKPTGGAFVWGVALLVALEGLRLRFDWQAWRPRFAVAFWTGLACVPLGGLWYVRNVALGHAVVDFPHPSWLSLAKRSADLLGWLWAALALIGAFLLVQKRVWRSIVPRKLCNSDRLLLGLALIALLVGALPSMPWIDPTRVDPPFSHIRLIEAALIVLGLLCAALLVYRQWWIEDKARSGLIRLGLAWGLALPYVITWFFSYSYHYRLLFAVTPLLMLPTAALLADWRWAMKPTWADLSLRSLAYASAGLLVLIGLLIPITNADLNGPDWLWTDKYPNDTARYYAHNSSTILLTEYLEGYQRETGQAPIIIAPAEQHLRFYHPEWTIITDSDPLSLDDLDGATHFVYSSFAAWRYADLGIAPQDNPIVASLGRREVFTPVISHRATFRYELYRVDTRKRWTEDSISPYATRLTERVVFGNFAELVAVEASNTYFYNTNVYTTLYLRPLAQTEREVFIAFDFVSHRDGQSYYRWEGPIAPHEHGHVSARLWQVGEIVHDVRRLSIPTDSGIPHTSYDFRLSMYYADDPDKTPIPVTIGQQTALYYLMPGRNSY